MFATKELPARLDTLRAIELSFVNTGFEVYAKRVMTANSYTSMICPKCQNVTSFRNSVSLKAH